VPAGNLDIRLWSDPGPGSLVHPGDRARLYFRTNADCYVTVFSVDTEGRVRLLFPGPREDGFVPGERTWSVPRRHAGYDLRFSGPPGIEYVYAVASFAPMYDRYPVWLSEGRMLDPYEWGWEDDGGVWETGWVVGDPFYRMRSFCERLVPDPHRTDSYATAYVYFHLGRRVYYPRYLCSDCHSAGWIDPYGPACSAVRIHVGDFACSGWIDFRIGYRPCFTYEVWRHWRPRGGCPPNWNGPGGRWVWSSADGRRSIRDSFRDAGGPGREFPGGDVRGGEVRDERKPDRDGWGRGPGQRPDKPESPWSRSHMERITRSLEEVGIGARDRTDRPPKEARPARKETREREGKDERREESRKTPRVEEGRKSPRSDGGGRSERGGGGDARSGGRSKSPERGTQSGGRGSGRAR
jgi:hypothetical protein